MGFCLRRRSRSFRYGEPREGEGGGRVGLSGSKSVIEPNIITKHDFEDDEKARKRQEGEGGGGSNVFIYVLLY